MCGIVGSIGLKNNKDFLIKGLKILDYRGYDSAGVALLHDKIDIYKYAGTVDNLEEKIKDVADANIGIGHTRWATHGRVSDANSHPHISNKGLFAIVHNGVIENYVELKNALLKKGYHFYGETDTEALVNLLESIYLEKNDVLGSLDELTKVVKGSFASAIIFAKEKDRLYLLKRSSPLLVGKCLGSNLVASDAASMISYTHDFIELDDDEYGYLTESEVHLYCDGSEVEHTVVTKNPELLEKNLNGFPHFMLKEIEEIESVVRRLILSHYDDGNFLFADELKERIRQSDHIIFIGCGTSYHASLVGARYFEQIGISCSCYIASEWAYYPLIPGRRPFVIMISQSGETADVIHCMNIVKRHHVKSLIITNSKGSSLERSADFSILLNAGLEVSVASTKAYSAQVAALALLANSINNSKKIISDFEKALSVVGEIRDEKKKEIKKIAKSIKDATNIFYLGRGYDYDLSLEASLKLKEISYIHSEAIAGGELKHGPIALIEEGLPVIVFISDDLTSAMMRGNIQEVKTRGAKVIVVSTKALAQEGDDIVLDDFPKELSAVAMSPVAFYLAYYVALYKGYNIDKPRNLAKSVTVE
ncbi:MAG: glutamine--fructose-6-phosphate transaminase (isomerizing) [Bacilli bacterium]|nr:glutamine--fructose-6-phosphate transaminase (isomerizing) [Bacilli bacterium]